MSGNKTTFNIRSVASKSFNFILDSFDYAVTFLFRIKQKFQIQFVSSALLKFTSTIAIKKVKLSFIPRTIGKILLSLKLKTVKLTVIARESGKLITALGIKKIKLTIFSRAISKIASLPFTIKKIKIGFIAIYGTVYTLAIYDPQTLGTLDPQTLGDLDFTIIP